VRFVFRADAFLNIGAGHVMRISALAEELISNNFDVIFIGETREIPWVQEYISTLGFSRILENSQTFTPNPDSDLLILDSYTVSTSDSFISPKNWLKIAAFIDETTPDYVANLYINASLNSNWLPPEKSKDSRMLVGLEFVQIRRSLRQIKSRREAISKGTPKLLVMGGGSDPFNFVGQLHKSLASLSIDFQATMISQQSTFNVESPKFLLDSASENVLESLENVDLVFSTAGTSSWEFIYLGIPLGIALAIENQESNYRYQTSEGLATGIGYRDINEQWNFDIEAINKLISDAFLMRDSRSVIDGNGYMRVYVEIMRLINFSK
jgi:spore coat polysaccharide biosynthesis predicted glycosyltransferase SpsG